MSVPQSVLDLIAHFERNLDDFKSGRYSEEHLRLQFLNRLFGKEGLGWDIYNDSQYAEAYKDVIHEDALRIGEGTKAPDYCFRIGGTRKFFLEAKKPSVDIKADIAPAYQLRRYAWTAKLPLSILTDFEEFAIYDCRIKPRPSDKASTARIFYCTFRELPEKWDYIASIFSRDAVLKGSFDKFAAENKVKRGTAEVDADFLEEIERWRKELAQNLALRNEKLTQRELNFAVQRIIDRIIFLRIAEDRGLETYGRLLGLTNGHRIYPRLCELFEAADARYNSGLFHFKKERDRHEAPDELTMRLDVDDKLLKDVLKNLYYPNSPYAFSVLSADILGQVYEQFLGKVITLTDGHHAKVDDKPEVKKAGGVYYTPTYIVDYIVRETVGKLVDGKAPKQVEKLRILDPACGSGSFLIGAYQFLLDWHLTYYMANDPAKWAKEITTARGSKGKHPVIVSTRSGSWQLSIAERKRILLNNIYGVDIDSQAVEVTKLSLLLKVLEGEAGLAQMNLGLADRVLPDLGDNIKCGNSLIGPDFYAQPDLPELNDEDRFRINVFNWHTEFPEVFKAGGFDAVIGNPPYLRIQGLQEYYGNQIGYFASHYRCASKRFDLYVLFLERGHALLSNAGRLGFICPHKFTNGDFASDLRAFLVQTRALRRLVSFGHHLVFRNASTYTGIVILQKSDAPNIEFAEVELTGGATLGSRVKEFHDDSLFTRFDYAELGASPWSLTGKSEASLLAKLSTLPQSISKVFEEVLVGIQSGIDDVHVLEERTAEQNAKTLTLYSPREEIHVRIEEALTKPFALGDDVERYASIKTSHRCIYPYVLVGDKTRILAEADLRAAFPLGFAYLERHRAYLTAIRVRQKTNPIFWYSCHRSRDMRVFETDRIVTPEISKGCNFTVASAGLYHNTQVYSLVPSASRKESLLYWLGILNSQVLWWYLMQTGTVLRGGFFRFKTNYLNPFPLPTCDLSDPQSKARHDRVVALVSRILDLHRQRAAMRTPQEQTSLDRQIHSTDAEIDRLVYELYGLTEEEIRIVEGAVSTAAETPEAESQAKSESAKPSELPNGQSTGQSEADAAHYYCIKEQPPDYN